MQGSQWSYRSKIHQDALGKVNRVKEIRRREKDGSKINDNKHYVRKKFTLLVKRRRCWGHQLFSRYIITRKCVVCLLGHYAYSCIIIHLEVLIKDKQCSGNYAGMGLVSVIRFILLDCLVCVYCSVAYKYWLYKWGFEKCGRKRLLIHQRNKLRYWWTKVFSGIFYQDYS